MQHLNNYYDRMEKDATKAVDTVFDSIPDEYKFNEVKVIGIVMRSVRGKAHPQYVQEAVRAKIKNTLKQMAARILNDYIRERGGFLGMSETQGWHYAKLNLLEALRDGTKCALPMDVLEQIATEAIVVCQQANCREGHGYRDEQAI